VGVLAEVAQHEPRAGSDLDLELDLRALLDREAAAAD
jgi:hypothetical protein